MHLYRMFNNRLYIGEIVHHDQHYPGEHEAIVPRDLFDKVQAILEENYRARGNKTRAKTPALLKGLIRCGHCGCAMGPSFTKKKGRTYRYYVCIQATKRGWDTCPVKNVAAGEIEGAVMAQMRAVFQSPELIAETCRISRQKETEEIERLKNERFDLAGELPKVENPLRRRDINERIAEIDGSTGSPQAATVSALRNNPLSEQAVAASLANLDQVWNELFPGEQSRIVSLLIERVVVSETGAEVIMRSDGLHTLVDELDSREERAATNG